FVWQEYLVFAYIVSYALDKVREISNCNGLTLRVKLQVHLSDLWNIYDLCICAFSLVGIALRVASVHSVNGAAADNSSFVGFYTNYSLLLLGNGSGLGDAHSEFARQFYVFFCSHNIMVISLALWLLRIFEVLINWKHLGPYLYMVATMISKMLPPVVIIFIPLCAFGIVRQGIQYPQYNTFNITVLKGVLLKPYFMLYGEVYAGEIDPDEWTGLESLMPLRCVVPIAMVIFLLVAVIVCISIIIAVFNDVYHEVHEKSKQVYKYLRFSIIIEYESMPMFPPPLTLVSWIFLTVRWLYHKRCRFWGCGGGGAGGGGGGAAAAAVAASAPLNLLSPATAKKPVHLITSLKLFLKQDEIEDLQDFEEECASRRSPHVSAAQYRRWRRQRDTVGGGGRGCHVADSARHARRDHADQTTPLLDTGYGISGGGGGGSSSQMLRLLSATNAPGGPVSVCSNPSTLPTPGGSGGGAAGGAVEAHGHRRDRLRRLSDVDRENGGSRLADVGAAGQTLEAMLRNAEEAERSGHGAGIEAATPPAQLHRGGGVARRTGRRRSELGGAATPPPVGRRLDSAGVTASESLINIVGGGDGASHRRGQRRRRRCRGAWRSAPASMTLRTPIPQTAAHVQPTAQPQLLRGASEGCGTCYYHLKQQRRYRIQAMSSPAADEAAKREATQPAAAAADTVGAAATPNGGNYKDSVNALRSTFLSGQTRPLSWRRKQLEALYALLTDQEDRIAEALWQDLRKCRQEAAAAELLILKADIAKLNRDLPQLTDIHKVKKTFISMMDNLGLQQQPYGVALIIGAWNYPFQLTLMPLAGAIAAGNCALPSEIASASAALLAELVPKYLDQSCIRVVCGGAKETQELLEQRFDYIFYTGSSRVGRLVMAAASKHLTPVTLELGGKSPVYVSEGVDLG
uniref:Ion_trans domain-containing protein n=1 Tax=Macrostomum lignano TaxID=282301 RepID=A0A1I8JNQ0_9PLAT